MNMNIKEIEMVKLSRVWEEEELEEREIEEEEANHILHYVQGTKGFGIHYSTCA